MNPPDIAEQLKREILSGKAKPGSELRQETLAARFGVSRIPVRDALNLLAAKKLVQVRQNRTAQVIRFSRGALAEAYSLRLMLEADALARAIPNMGLSDFENIEQEARRCEIEAGHESFPEADWRFHEALYAAAARPLQIALIEELRMTCQVHVSLYDQLRQGRDGFSEDHRRIVAACRSLDVDAATQALRQHLESAAAALDAAMAASAED